MSRPARNVEKRQATLQLTFCADQAENIKPGICFRAVPHTANGEVNPKLPKSKRLKNENYAPSVNVYFQKNAYFDTHTCLAYAKDFKRETKSAEKLHQMDNLKGQSCPEFRKFMKEEANTLLLYTPPGCTDLCAAVDAGLGKSIKSLMKSFFEDDYENRMDLWDQNKISARK